MKRYLNPIYLIYCFITCVIINSYALVKFFPYTLIILFPAFIYINFCSGILMKGTKSIRLRICNHGTLLLSIFVCSIIPTIIWHTVYAFLTIPHSYMDFVWSVICAFATSMTIFWIGILCVYTNSSQMGLKWRIIGILSGAIPILNQYVLGRIIKIVADEIEYELERESITNNPALSKICETKYPIVLLHGIFFRDSRIINYWGRIPRTLKLHGANIYYGQHQSALSVKESAREVASRIKLIVERTGCEKVNVIAHSKGGLDCRYAISEFGLAPYIASLTTVNSPHRGCIFAERLLYAVPENVKNKIAKTYNLTYTVFGDEEPDFLAAVSDMTADACQKRNEMLKFPDDIYAQSIGSVMNKPRSGKFPFNLAYRYIKNFDGENDGLVGESSFAWGEKYTLLRTEKKRGISHGDVIDMHRENLKGFDVRGFYTDLVSDLRERGL